VRREEERPHADRFDGNDRILVAAGRTGYSPSECHGGESLLQSAHSAAGAVSAIGWISAAGRSAVWRGPANEGHAGTETAISEFDFCGNSLQLFAGFFAARRASRGARGVDGLCWPRADGPGVSRDFVGCHGRK